MAYVRSLVLAFGCDVRKNTGKVFDTEARAPALGGEGNHGRSEAPLSFV